MPPSCLCLLHCLLCFFLTFEANGSPLKNAIKKEKLIERPRLVLQIVIDQLRGDLIQHHFSSFQQNGFRFLYAHGIDYANTHQPQANTVTCTGHAIISTGSLPIFNGIVSNRWYDPLQKQEVYCVKDLDSPILSTKRTKKKLEGRSPRSLMVSTLSDEIILAHRGRAYAVSFKDRAAIPLAGHAGKAFWFDKINGGFISSKYYYTHYPHWVENWNNVYTPSALNWTLAGAIDSYKHVLSPKFNNRFQQFNTTFPHVIGSPNNPFYYKYLSMTPFADDLTAAFAVSLLQAEKLGKSKKTIDYLAISFSATDAVGHQFGPNSLEAEDNLIRLDATIAKLLTIIDQEVGLKHTLIVLTSDHGISDSAAYLSQHNMPLQPPISVVQLKQKIQFDLKTRFNLPPSTLEAVSLPYIYLNHDIIKAKEQSISKVRRYIAKKLKNEDGVFEVFSLPITMSLKTSLLNQKVAHMSYPNRSGDLYVVPTPFQAPLRANAQRIYHGSPWRYDSYVPLVFTHMKFIPQRFFRPIETTDIAATLSSIFLIKPPSANIGQPLPEVVTYFQAPLKRENNVSSLLFSQLDL